MTKLGLTIMILALILVGFMAGVLTGVNIRKEENILVLLPPPRTEIELKEQISCLAAAKTMREELLKLKAFDPPPPKKHPPLLSQDFEGGRIKHGKD